MDHLTEDQRQELEDVFNIIDENKNGAIDLAELTKGLRCLGLNPTSEDIFSLLQEFDVDKNQLLDRDEFFRLYLKYTETCTSREDSLLAQFKKLDKNGDGFIDIEELKKILMFGEDKLTEEEVAEVLRYFDVNSDGKITLNEFIQGVLSKDN